MENYLILSLILTDEMGSISIYAHWYNTNISVTGSSIKYVRKILCVSG